MFSLGKPTLNSYNPIRSHLATLATRFMKHKAWNIKQNDVVICYVFYVMCFIS